MEKWIECKISDIGTVVGGATPSTKKPENYEKVSFSLMKTAQQVLRTLTSQALSKRRLF